MIAATTGSSGGGAATAIMLFLWICLCFALPMFVGSRIGARKGRTNGIWYGLWLGWLGVIILACRSTLSHALSKEQQYAELTHDVKLAELRARQTAIAEGISPR